MKIVAIIDVQNDFITGSLGTPEAQAMLPRLIEKIESEDEKTIYIFTKDTHYTDYLHTPEGKKLPVEHCVKGTDGWEFPDSLIEVFGCSPDAVEKSTFGSAELMSILSETISDAGGANIEIEFCGLCTDICVVSNVLMAKTMFPEVKITVNSELCAGVSPATHEAALTTMKMCQVDVI